MGLKTSRRSLMSNRGRSWCNCPMAAIAIAGAVTAGCATGSEGEGSTAGNGAGSVMSTSASNGAGSGGMSGSGAGTGTGGAGTGGTGTGGTGGAAGAPGCSPGGLDMSPPAQTHKIKNLTGSGTSSQQFGVGGTDLGIPVRQPNGKIAYIFGDTFEQDTVGGPGWRAPVLLR